MINRAYEIVLKGPGPTQKLSPASYQLVSGKKASKRVLLFFCQLNELLTTFAHSGVRPSDPMHARPMLFQHMRPMQPYQSEQGRPSSLVGLLGLDRLTMFASVTPSNTLI
ncbi:hypothetical protein NUW54_g2586 [Trametes sanguinea]|uniref:Uncharacterized protein n=1 Tax=Trametes sanguinea TaxID=158606 RepID=A0ACC1Q6A3_9APHY|nr:hypothetical protein NUW54_g2586 [Trametes sanguinea]